MIHNLIRHPLESTARVCVPLVILGAALFVSAGAARPASARTVRTTGGVGVGGVQGTATTTATAPGAWITAPVTTTAPAPLVRQVGGVRSVSGAGITLHAPQTGLLNGTVSFTGTVAQAGIGETVTIEREGPFRGYWVPAASAPVGRSGVFRATWRVSQSGSLPVRAVLDEPYTTESRTRAVQAGDAVSASAALPATPALTLTVYRSAIATLYGPGFYGRRTACGERLTQTMLGVANRTLKCGTKVAIYFAGRELVVPVIDRGPYANGASWDLTMATARAIGISATVTIGALSPPPAD